MGRDEKLESFVETLKLLVAVAKAVPILGPCVEGSLEAAITVIEYTQVRGLSSWSRALLKQLRTGRAEKQTRLARARVGRSTLDRGARQGAEQRASSAGFRPQEPSRGDSPVNAPFLSG
jgi:hypothetical protein